MYINLESDYAVRIVICLCQSDGRMDAKRISEQTAVPQRFALKILRKLVSAQIIQSFKGAKGGYCVKRSPHEIDLLEIIEVVEGRYCFSRCLDNKHPCDGWCKGKGCKVQNIYSKISNMVRDELSAITIDTLL